jgi:pimeloyl-ACP methyl ester carboxylesterase
VLTRSKLTAVALVMLTAGAPVGVPAAAAAVTNPVVLVHGLNSSPRKWAPYLGADGFLATIGRQGFAVGDGQVPGALRTGSDLEPFAETNTIAENAEILRDYIAGVKRRTGADQVDVVAHSMGGLISRYYIDRLMGDRDVERLVMLGTPNGGSPCANLAARLRVSIPATLELRPSYVKDVFNRQITNRRGTAFFALAGDALTDNLRSPCAGTPSDLVVGVDSVQAAGVTATRLPVLHNSINASAEVFEEFVKPSLATTGGSVAGEAAGGGESEPPQTITLASGHVDKGRSVEQIILIDEVAVATFAVYDPTRSLAVSVRGAGGQIIELSAAENGLIRIDDPETLLYLGYGFTNPQPGPWRVRLHSTRDTPAAGADYAVSAQVTGGADLTARVSELLPEVGQEVRLSASLDDGGEPVGIESAVARVRTPQGRDETVTLAGDGTGPAGVWRPAGSGLHSIDVTVTGRTASGARVERTAFLAAEVQPDAEDPSLWLPVAAVIGVVFVVIGGVGLVVVVALMRLGRRRRSGRAS